MTREVHSEAERAAGWAPVTDRPERPDTPPATPPPPAGVSRCVRDDRCQLTPGCRHYGACRIATVLFERTQGRRL